MLNNSVKQNYYYLYLNRGSTGKYPQPDECNRGCFSTPIIQHSEGKKSQGFGDGVPYSQKDKKKAIQDEWR